jgi:hypothetical protein
MQPVLGVQHRRLRPGKCRGSSTQTVVAAACISRAGSSCPRALPCADEQAACLGKCIACWHAALAGIDAGNDDTAQSPLHLPSTASQAFCKADTQHHAGPTSCQAVGYGIFQPSQAPAQPADMEPDLPKDCFLHDVCCQASILVVEVLSCQHAGRQLWAAPKLTRLRGPVRPANAARGCPV